MRLLIVNDEIIAAKSMQVGLDWKSCGIEQADTAFSAASAKKKMQENPYDLVLCDIEMPGENGIELVRWIRKMNFDTEIIFLTCHADFAYAQEAIQLGCRNYILSPARDEEILASVSKTAEELKEKRDSRQKVMYGDLWLAGQKEQIQKEKGTITPEQIVDDVKNYIAAHLGESDLSLTRIADEVHLNPDYMNRVFKKETGTSVGKYITSSRMKLAADMISNRGILASEAAQLTGYASYPSFVSAFKNCYGCSPTQYHKGQE